MRDRFSCVEGTRELTLHIGASQRFMPGLRLQRDGDVRHCQGTVLAEWAASVPTASRARAARTCSRWVPTAGSNR